MHNTESKLLNKEQETRIEDAIKALKEVIDEIQEQTSYEASMCVSVAFISEDKMCELGRTNADTFMTKAKHASHSKILQELSAAGVVAILGGNAE